MEKLTDSELEIIKALIDNVLLSLRTSTSKYAPENIPPGTIRRIEQWQSIRLKLTGEKLP